MKKRIVALVLALALTLSMITTASAYSQDHQTKSKWDDWFANTWSLVKAFCDAGSATGHVPNWIAWTQDRAISYWWGLFENTYLEVLPSGGGFDTGEVSYETLVQRARAYEESLNAFLRANTNGTGEQNYFYDTYLQFNGRMEFQVRWDDINEQYRIFCVSNNLWLVQQDGSYHYAKKESAIVSAKWVKSNLVSWTNISRVTMADLQTICNTLIANGRDCKIKETGDWYIIFDNSTLEVYCNKDGAPFGAPNAPSAADEERDHTETESNQIISVEGGTININGNIEFVENIIYNTENKFYTVNSYYYNNTTNEYIYNTYEVSYHYDYTYVVNIGSTAMDQESYKFYYNLPDGRNSADLTMEDLVSLSVNFDIITYDKAIDTGTLKYLYHFDGDLLPDSYYDADMYGWSTLPSIQYMDSGVFGGALYLDSNLHKLPFNFDDTYPLWEDTFLMFRYYYSPTQDSSSIPIQLKFGSNEVFRIQGESIVLGGNSTYTGDVLYDAGQWVEYGFWWHYESQEIEIFLNGYSVGRFPFSLSTPGVNDNPCKWELIFPDKGRVFGYLDEVRYYSGTPEEFNDYLVGYYMPTAVPVDSNMILVLPDTEELNAPTLAVQTGERITGYRIGGVRPSDPRQGQVWAQLENNIITSLQVYNGVSWVECEGRVWTGSRWIPLYAFNVVTMADYFDVIGTYDNSTIHSDSGFWTWFQKSWNDFRSWLDGFKLDNQENWNTLFAYLEEKSCNHNWVLVESVYADYCDSNGHSAITDYIGNSDGGTHQLQSHCTVCSSILSSVSENCVDANGDGSCDSCSQTMDPCFSGHSAGDIRYTSNNNGSSHTVVNACTVCGDTVSSTTALCTDANEDLICDLCFQQLPDQDPCADGHTVKTSTVANNNMTNHTVIGVCSVCGEEQSRNTVNCSNDGSDHCSVCGQALTACADGHSPGNKRYGSRDNGESHTVNIRCTVCDALLSNYAEDCTDADGDDYCDLCGQDVGEETIYYPTMVDVALSTHTSTDGNGNYYAATSATFDYLTGTYTADYSVKVSPVDDEGESYYLIKPGYLFDHNFSGSVPHSKHSNTTSTIVGSRGKSNQYCYPGTRYSFTEYGVTTNPDEACELPSYITGVNAPTSAYSLFSLRGGLQGEWKYDLYCCSICGEEYRDYTGDGAPKPSVDVDMDVDMDIDIDLSVKDPDQEDGTLSIFDLLKMAIGAGTKMIDFLYQFGIKDALDNFNENMDYLIGLYVDDTVDITEQDDSIYDIPSVESEDPLVRDEVTIWDY